MEYSVLVLPGDGIGPEVIAQAAQGAACPGMGAGPDSDIVERQMGMTAYEREGEVLSAATLDLAKRSDAILFGATGGAAYDALPAELRNRTGLRLLRKSLGLFANFRPAFIVSRIARAPRH